MSADVDPDAISSGVEVTATVDTVAVPLTVCVPFTLCPESAGWTATVVVGAIPPPDVSTTSESAFAAQAMPLVSESSGMTW